VRAVHPAPSGAPLAIGQRLRASRNRQGLTIEQLAEATGLTKGFISKVERNLTSPSVASLATICQVLSLPIGLLFDDPDLYVINAEAAPAINLGGTAVSDRLLTPRGERRVQVVHSVAEAGGSGGQELYTVNCEIEVLHVTSGHVRVEFATTTLDLRDGDTLTIPGAEPHTWHALVPSRMTWTLVPAPWSGSSASSG
jgi:transcriptional regulator with XRE-family HTH domain